MRPFEAPDTVATLGPGNADALSQAAAALLSEQDQMVVRAIKRANRAAPGHALAMADAGEELATVSHGMLSVLIASLQAGGELLFEEAKEQVRAIGKRRCAQGVPLEVLTDWWLLHRDVVLEGLKARAGASPELVLLAQQRLEAECAQLNLQVTRGYFDYMKERYEEERAELQALIRVARSVNQSLEVADVAEAGLHETMQAMNLESGAFWVVQDGKMGLAHATGLTDAEVEALGKVDLKKSRFVARVALSTLPLQDTLVPRSRVFKGPRSLLGVALRSKGELLGTLVVATRQPRSFTEAELEFVAAVADHIALALEHAREHRREARTDYLTGLANRPEFERAMRREVAAAGRHGRPLTLMLMDLDQLKRINDTFGHHAGDEAIRAVAEALRRVVRASDTSARLGGDEFALAMPVALPDHAQDVQDRIRAALVEIGEATRLPMPIELSFGIACWQEGQDAAAFFKVADQALYRDKRLRRANRRGKAAAGRAAGVQQVELNI